MSVDAALWCSTVAETVRECGEPELLVDAGFISSLDHLVDDEGQDLANGVAEAVEQWLEAEYNRVPAGSDAGGEFAPAGAAQQSKKKAPAKRAPAKPSGELGYDGKTGAGYGTKGGDARVKSLQQALNRLGLKDADGKPLAVDGKFGPKTTAAVKALQKSLGLEQTGKVTPALIAKASKAKSLDELKQQPAAKPRAREAAEAIADAANRVTEAVTDVAGGRVLEARGEDGNGGRIFRVQLIQYGTSRNGKRYTEAVMRRDRARYEGAKAYDRHRSLDDLKSSTIAGIVGQYRNVEATSVGLEADLHLLPSATHAAEALDASIEAQTQGLPPLIGLSHDVHIDSKPVLEGGRRVQEAMRIVSVNSVDLVADPSAGGKAVRVLAGGTEDQHDPTDTEECDVTVTTEAVLDAISKAGDEQLAALGLQRTGTHTTEATERVTEAAQPKGSMVAQLLIREKLADAGLTGARESILARLPGRIVEADIDREIAAYKTVLADVERAELRPTVTVEVARESLDKKKAALDAFFEGDYTKGYSSFRQAYLDFTGYRPKAFDTDLSRQIFRESFGGGFDSGDRATESMDTSTWAQVLGDSITRRMVSMYRDPSLQTWRKVVSNIESVSDFRTQRVGRIGGYGTLPTVLEGGPYQPLTSPADEEATGALVKKGGTEDVTLEMIANDDRRAIAQIPRKLGRAAAQTLYRGVWDIFANNSTATYDSTALFHSDHGNTDSSAGLQQSTLSTGRRKMIEQAAYGDTSEILAITPRYIVVPPELEETAFVLSGRLAGPASNTVGASDQPNIHAGIEPILVPYWTDANDWFLVADPNDVPTLEVGFFNGRQEPELFTQADNNVGSVFNADVFTWKVRFIFYVMILDHRGVYRGQG